MQSLSHSHTLCRYISHTRRKVMVDMRGDMETEWSRCPAVTKTKNGGRISWSDLNPWLVMLLSRPLGQKVCAVPGPFVVWKHLMPCLSWWSPEMRVHYHHILVLSCLSYLFVIYVMCYLMSFLYLSAFSATDYPLCFWFIFAATTSKIRVTVTVTFFSFYSAQMRLHVPPDDDNKISWFTELDPFRINCEEERISREENDAGDDALHECISDWVSAWMRICAQSAPRAVSCFPQHVSARSQYHCGRSLRDHFSQLVRYFQLPSGVIFWTERCGRGAWDRPFG